MSLSLTRKHFRRPVYVNLLFHSKCVAVCWWNDVADRRATSDLDVRLCPAVNNCCSSCKHPGRVLAPIVSMHPYDFSTVLGFIYSLVHKYAPNFTSVSWWLYQILTDFHNVYHVLTIIMVALCNRAYHYIFALWFLSSIYLFFPRLISAAADWMSTILLHMAWP